MKKSYIFAITLSFILVACSAPVATEDVAPQVIETEVVDIPVTDDTVSSPTSEIPAAPQTDAPTAIETEGILFMREEEKLARDVYLTLYDQWDILIFQNIAGSEQSHMDAVLSLLERYGVEDPAAGKEIGEFTNPDLQALYDQLVAQGEQSLSDALKVGAAIEEIDILDLEEYVAQTDKDDIRIVYDSLAKGSRNHLRAFTKTLLQQTGEVYAPQYLSQDAYDAIINSGAEPSGGY